MLAIKRTWRGLVGDSNPHAKFSDTEVELMRQLFDGGMRVSDIAQKFDCTKGYVSKVCSYGIRATTAEVSTLD